MGACQVEPGRGVVKLRHPRRGCRRMTLRTIRPEPGSLMRRILRCREVGRMTCIAGSSKTFEDIVLVTCHTLDRRMQPGQGECRRGMIEFPAPHRRRSRMALDAIRAQARGQMRRILRCIVVIGMTREAG